jgi:copper oxidase (laccase) domain-containing protein
LAAGVIEQTVALMRSKQIQQSQTQIEILAYLGPAIGPHAFEVGSEVRDIFMAQDPASAACFEQLQEKGKYLADIYGLACLRLNALGIEQIEGGGECTLQNPDYFSYRRDQQTGRMGSFIWIDAA